MDPSRVAHLVWVFHFTQSLPWGAKSYRGCGILELSAEGAIGLRAQAGNAIYPDGSGSFLRTPGAPIPGSAYLGGLQSGLDTHPSCDDRPEERGWRRNYAGSGRANRLGHAWKLDSPGSNPGVSAGRDRVEVQARSGTVGCGETSHATGIAPLRRRADFRRAANIRVSRAREGVFARFRNHRPDHRTKAPPPLIGGKA